MKKIHYIIFQCACILFAASAYGQEQQSQDSTALPVAKETLVGVAYGEMPAWKVTEAQNVVKGEDLRVTSSALSNALYGRLPGLTVVQGSGEPGNDSPTMFIRGLSSYRNNRVLTFVDGFESTFDELVPDEIESITVLKDAAATALYGIRGANGILLVKTKRGRVGPPEIQFSAQTGFQRATPYPKALGSYDYARLYNEALENEGKPLKYTDADLEAYRNGSDPYFHPNVDWAKEVLKETARVSNYNLNFRGGSESARYFVLLNVFQNEGLYANTDPKRKESTNAHFLKYNFRSNVDIDITKRLGASLYLAGRIEDRYSPAGVSSGTLFNQLLLTPPNAFPVYNPNGTYGGNSVYNNPVGAVLSTGIFNDHTRNLQATFKLDYDLDFITPGLSIDGAVSFSNFFSGFSAKNRTFVRYEIAKVGDDIEYYQIGDDTPLTAVEGYLDQTRRSNTRFGLNYTKSSGDHDIDIMTMFLRDRYVIRGNNVPFAYENLAGRVTYAFKKKYIGQVSLSYSGSDNFPKGNRHGFFPAVSAGWVLSEENFAQGSDWLDFLKLRVSHGVTGNDQIGGLRFMYVQNFYQDGGFNLGNNNNFFPGYFESNLANADVTWEKRKTTNIGLEADLLQRLHINLDVFTEERYDILAEPFGTIPDFMGVALPALNEGRVKNKGFELALHYASAQDKAFKYFAAGSASFARNEIIYMSEAPVLYDYLKRTGGSVSQPFGLISDGFYQESDFDVSGVLKEGLPVPQFGPVRPGDIKYVNQNDDNVIDVYDYKPIGKPQLPEWTFGLHTGFEYKAFDFSVFVQAVTNSSVYMTGSNYWAFQNNAGITDFALNRWTPETATTADYPRLSTSANEHNFRLSDFWQRDGSFLRLRMVEVGYTIPSRITNFVKIGSARIFANGLNLLTIDKVDVADPETISGYPFMKSINIGVKAKF